MAFFQRILKFDEAAVLRQEKRLARRFALPPTSPLRLTLQAPQGPIAAKIIDLSSAGIGFELPPPAFDLARGERCVLRLEMETHALELNASISRVTTAAPGILTVGADLTHNDYPSRRNLVQLLEPIEIGSTLQPINPASVTQTEPGLVSIRYYSSDSSALTLWRNLSDQNIEGFEWRLHDYYVRSGAVPPELNIYVSDTSGMEGGSNFGRPTLRPSQEDSFEVRRLFRWILPYLNSRLPDDLRDFLTAYGTRAP